MGNLRKKLLAPMFTTEARGIGIGLVVSKNPAEVNGGSIEVGRAVSKGSAFTVTLPVGGKARKHR